MFKINNKLYSKFGYIFISVWMSVPRYFNGNEVSNKMSKKELKYDFRWWNKEERAREDREDEAIEQKLRNDFDFFEDYFSDKFEELDELKKEVKNLYESYGWEMEEWQ